MNLTRLQEERDRWIASNFPRPVFSSDFPELECVLGAAEEIGELCHHLLKLAQGIRGERAHHREEMADAVADCVIYLAGVATHLGLDYGQLVQETWDRVKLRDWVADPTTGGE
jgi:NTP pyrophosphatase (non-canonical NTP hydrolase)